MKCTPVKSAFTLLTVASFAIAGSVQARIFKDTKDREIEAEIVASSGPDKIIIERAGKEFPVPINMFSLDDQVYIKEWKESNPDKVRIDADFSYYIDLSRADTDSKETKYLQSRMQTQNWTYDFSVTNKGDNDLEDIRIVYQIIIADIVDAKGNYNRMAYTNQKADLKIQRIKEEVKVAVLPAQKRADIKKTFGVEKYVDRDGSAVAVAAQDKITGIWIRIYKGDLILGDYRRPATGESMKDIPWDENERGKPTAVIR